MDQEPHRQLARKNFTDRELPVDTFNRLLSKRTNSRLCTPNPYRIISWYGDGGQGKSALCHRLMQEVDRQKDDNEKLVCLLIDFHDPEYLDVKKAMLKLREDTHLAQHVTFSTFDAAFCELFRRQSPGSNIRECHPHLFRQFGNEFIEDFLNLANSVGNGLLPGIDILFKWGGRLTGRSLDWWQRRGTKELVDEMKDLSVSDLRERLPFYMGRDICQGLEEDDEFQFVLLLDTFEALFPNGTSSDRHINTRSTQWIKALIQTTPGALIAIFGRDQVQWLEDGTNFSIEHHLLEGLSEKDANSFLVGAGIQEERIRQRILKAAQGIPYYLDIAVDDYWQIKASGRQPTLCDFGKNKIEVTERFLSHLSAGERNEILLASYPEPLDEELFAEMSQAFLGGMFSVDWKRLVGRSFIDVDPKGRARMHQLMKEHMQATDRINNPSRYQSAHRWLFKLHDRIAFETSDPRSIREIHDQALGAAAYHLAQSDPEKLLDWFNDPRLTIYYDAERWNALSHMAAVVEAVTKSQQNTNAGDMACFYHSCGHILQRTGDFSNAVSTFRSALEEQDRAFGKPKAYTIQAIADALLELNEDLEQAEAHFWRASEMYSQEKNSQHVGRANCLLGLASTRAALEKQNEAESYLQEACAVYRTYVDEIDPEYIGFLRKLHKVHCDWGEFDDALQRLDEAREILEKNRQTDCILYAEILADMLDCPGQYGMSEQLERAQALVNICESVCGCEHRLFGRALHLEVKYKNLHSVCSDGDIEQVHRGLEILECTLGPNHAWTIEAQKLLQLLR